MTFNVSSFPAVVAFPLAERSTGRGDERCLFARQQLRWTLLEDCELSTPLDLPGPVTLDGGGHIITLAGDAEGFESAAIRANGGDIVNLTVDGSALLPRAPAYFAAISLAAPGRISHTTVRNVQFEGAGHSAIGIEVSAFDEALAMVQDIALQDIGGAGLLLTGTGQVTAERVYSQGAAVAVQVNGTATARLCQVAVEDARVGVLAQDQSRVRINASSATGERVAEDEARIHQDTLTFIGAGESEQARQQAAAVAAMRQGRLG